MSAVAEREPHSIAHCVHFTSVATTCRVGVDPGTVTDDDGRMPCVVIRGITGTIACDKLQLPAKPGGGEPGRMGKMLSKLLDGICPTCGEAIRGELELDGQVIAMPCRHVIRSARSA